MTFIFTGCSKSETSDTSKANPEPVSPALVSAAACSAPAWASLNGGTTGGGAAIPTIVTTYNALKAAIQDKSIKVIQVNGTITIPSGGRISFQDQTGKTLFGSANAKLVSTDQTRDKNYLLKPSHNEWDGFFICIPYFYLQTCANGYRCYH